MPKKVNLEHGRKLLTAVERILAPTEDILALVAKHEEKARAESTDEADLRKRASTSVIRHYSNRAAVVGAASTLTGFIPGIGTLAAALGGQMLDATMLLKWEVEMSLCLAQLHGFDITDNAHRQLAFLMASVGTYDAQSGRSFTFDAVAAEREALALYSPRRTVKFIETVLASYVLLRLGRGMVRFLPLVGPAVGLVSNKSVTQKVGERCRKDFETRRELLGKSSRETKPRSKASRRTAAKPTATRRRSARTRQSQD